MPDSRPRSTWWWLLALAAVLAVLVVPGIVRGSGPSQWSYSHFTDQVRQDHVATVTVDPHGEVKGKTDSGGRFTTQVPTALGPSDLLPTLRQHSVAVHATGNGGTPWGTLLADLLPVLLLVGLFWWLSRRARSAMGGKGGGGLGGLGGLSSIGRSKVKTIEATRPKTRFDDVAGYTGVKREVTEVVDYLREPAKYRRTGARGPTGVLLVGPPGVGKTLLARAVAGEASVPFLSVDGSSFVEMFVGVGAARVRDLFEQARQKAPSIVFIDEIDSLGQRRSGGGGVASTNDEREQTLHQMLAELDGFSPSTNVVVIAATNRPEALDQALLRPGRFDRQVTVSLPTRDERRAILGVHTRGKPLAGDIDLDVVARLTPGFSGADLANLVNEAAIFAVRTEHERITADDFHEARDRILIGRRDDSQALLPDEQRRIAVHESGHALVATLCEEADPVAKVTILPAGQALGSTQQLPEEERHIQSEGQLLDTLAVRMGGRAAELVVYGAGSTGAANDVTGATRLATRMVRDLGLSRRLGPVGFGSGRADFLGGDEPAAYSRTYAEATQRVIDEEVSQLLRDAENRALDLLRRHRGALDRLAARLVEEETVDGSAVQQALRDDLAERPRSA